MTTPRPDAAITRLPTQVLRAYKRLVQYFWEQGLDAGDRLPPQAELRQLLGKNNYTLGAAMQALANQGVIARKTGAGTVVRDLDAIGPVPWSVGVATVEAPVDGELSVFANLTLRAQTRLNRLGCRCICYSRPVTASLSRVELFGLLEHDLAEGDLDALVLLTPFDTGEWAAWRERRVPFVHLPFWEQAPAGVITDHRAMVRQAVAELAREGCRRFAAVGVQPPADQPRYLLGLREGLAEAGLAEAQGEWLDGRFGEKAGERLGRELLTRAPGQRPDAVIVVDDYIALGLSRVFAEAAHPPRLATIVHRELPLAFAMPVIQYAASLEILVQRAVELLLERLRQPLAPERLDFLPPVLQPYAEPAAARPQPRGNPA